MLVDLHNHSCLSPCASLEMSPRQLAAVAARRGLDLVALTDHNTARNCPAFAESCRREGIAGFFGLEVTTSEECHVLALFDAVDTALRMDAWVRIHQPAQSLNTDLYNDQVVVDADDNIIEMVGVFLGAAITRGIEAVAAETHRLGGLFIPSHINRAAFSIETQLGFLPPGSYDAIEVVPGSEAIYRQRYPWVPVITASDAHSPDQIGRAAFNLPLKRRTVAGVRDALQRLLKT